MEEIGWYTIECPTCGWRETGPSVTPRLCTRAVSVCCGRSSSSKETTVKCDHDISTPHYYCPDHGKNVSQYHRIIYLKRRSLQNKHLLFSYPLKHIKYTK